MVVTVCVGSSCHLKGSKQIIDVFQKKIKENELDGKVELRGSFCMGQCVNGVGVKLEGQLYSLHPEEAEIFFAEHILGGGKK